MNKDCSLHDSAMATRGGVRATVYSIAGNLLLVGAKTVAGILLGSSALIADGIHSAADLTSDLVVLLGIWIGSKPADHNHPYGYGKFETLATSVISILLLGAGASIIYHSALELLAETERFSGWNVLIIAGMSIVIKEWLYHLTIRIGRRYNLRSLQANAWHHRTDALSSLAVVGGAVLGILGWGSGDSVSAIVVGVMISLIGLRFLYGTLAEFLEANIDKDSRARIDEVLEKFPAVRHPHQIRTRRVGRVIQLDFHVLVDPELSLQQAHDISEGLEQALHSALDFPLDVLVHVEPDLPRYRETVQHSAGKEPTEEES